MKQDLAWTDFEKAIRFSLDDTQMTLTKIGFSAGWAAAGYRGSSVDAALLHAVISDMWRDDGMSRAYIGFDNCGAMVLEVTRLSDGITAAPRVVVPFPNAANEPGLVGKLLLVDEHYKLEDLPPGWDPAGWLEIKKPGKVA